MKSMRFLPLLFCTVAFAQHPSELEAVVTTDLGAFRFEFAPDKAPKHVEQFIKLARQGYYDGSAFHRVVANGIIQGGDPLLKDPKTPRNLWGTGGLNLLPGEFSDLKHERGVVSTVRIPNKPDSDGAQFFVCVSPQPSLDGQFSAFGRVTEGMDVVEKISQVPADADGIAEKPVRILKVTIEKKKVEPFLNATPGRDAQDRDPEDHARHHQDQDGAGLGARTRAQFPQAGRHRLVQRHRLPPHRQGLRGAGRNGEFARGRRRRIPADRWVHPLKGEFRDDVKHVRGIVSMARTDDPNSATTSFFLMLGPAPHLDGQYSAFGRIVEGMEVLDAFEKEELDGETPKRRLEIIEASVDK